jgi:hypothetical protein
MLPRPGHEHPNPLALFRTCWAVSGQPNKAEAPLSFHDSLKSMIRRNLRACGKRRRKIRYGSAGSELRPASSEMYLHTEIEPRGALELPATMYRNFRPLREDGRRRPMPNSVGKITTINLG